jgi:hypothetical protein
MEPNEITLVGWVDEALEQSFTKKKVKSRFRATSNDFSTPRQWIARFNL